MYDNKWETIRSFDLLREAPDTLFGEDEAGTDAEGMMYVIHYKTFKIIRKAKKKRAEPTERELKERAVRKARRGIKSLWKQMHGEMATFTGSLLSGDIPEADDLSGVPEAIWKAMTRMEPYVSRDAIIRALSGKEAYALSADERVVILEQAYALPLYKQMLPAAMNGCKEIDIVDADGHYIEYSGVTASILIECLARFGFSFGEEEYGRVVDGTHELYIPAVPTTAMPEGNDGDAIVEPVDGYAGNDLAGSVEDDIEFQDAVTLYGEADAGMEADDNIPLEQMDEIDALVERYADEFDSAEDASKPEDLEESDNVMGSAEDELDAEGFIPIEESGYDIGFINDMWGSEPDLSKDGTPADAPIEDEYPTVYSTDDSPVYVDGISGITVSSEDSRDVKDEDISRIAA